MSPWTKKVVLLPTMNTRNVLLSPVFPKETMWTMELSLSIRPPTPCEHHNPASHRWHTKSSLLETFWSKDYGHLPVGPSEAAHGLKDGLLHFTDGVM